MWPSILSLLHVKVYPILWDCYFHICTSLDYIIRLIEILLKNTLMLAIFCLWMLWNAKETFATCGGSIMLSISPTSLSCLCLLVSVPSLFTLGWTLVRTSVMALKKEHLQWTFFIWNASSECTCWFGCMTDSTLCIHICMLLVFIALFVCPEICFTGSVHINYKTAHYFTALCGI